MGVVKPSKCLVSGYNWSQLCLYLFCHSNLFVNYYKSHLLGTIFCTPSNVFWSSHLQSHHNHIPSDIMDFLGKSLI